MAIIRSYGALQTVAAPARGYTTVAAASGHGYGYSYARIYETQPAVRTVVDFLARNVAQLGLHVFRRLSDTDRERLAKHPLADTIRMPNPHMTRYRLFENLMLDIGIFFNAYFAKVRSRDRLGLVWLPAAEVTVEGGLFPRSFTWESAQSGEAIEFPASEIVHFGLYSPCNPLKGLAPIETLRRILAEEAAVSEYRAALWRNGAKISGVIERPKDAPKWNDPQRKAFRDGWRNYQGGRNAGGTPVLEDGMTFKPTTQTARDAELTAGRKLTREEVAAAYHIPLPMVGILDHATFSNIKEQHKQLYQDALGPWLVFIEEEFERQVVPEFADREGVYLEFNIHEKLKGSFEEQADGLVKMTGRPILTLNEARARINLPRITDDPAADKVASPLNMTTGEAGNETAGDAATDAAAAPPADLSPEARGEAFDIVRAHWRRQHARLAKVPPDDQGRAFTEGMSRWTRELAQDLQPLLGTEAERAAAWINQRTAALLDAGEAAFNRPISWAILSRP